jgi:hypothetical protein
MPIRRFAGGNGLERPSLFHLGTSAPQALDVTDQRIAATAGQRKRVEKRSTLDLEPPIAGHPSLPYRFGRQGAELVIGPRFTRTRWRFFAGPTR